MTPSLNKTAPIILIMGTSGCGKTEAAKIISNELGGVHINADYVRKTISKTLGFSISDRMTQAERMGSIANLIADSGICAVADFICPTKDTRKMFYNQIVDKQVFCIWMNTRRKSIYRDTDYLFEDPIELKHIEVKEFIEDKQLFNQDMLLIASKIRIFGGKNV